MTDEDDYNFCDFLFEFKKENKIPQGLSEAKNIQINFHCKVKELLTVEDYWTECQYYDIV